ESDYSHRLLLRARNVWPRRRRATKKRDELASLHSTTSSAWASTIRVTERSRSAAGASIASLGPLHCAVRQADENRGHPPVLHEPDSFGQRETRHVAISRPILRQQIVGKSMPDCGLEGLSGQTASPVARVTEHLELGDPA